MSDKYAPSPRKIRISVLAPAQQAADNIDNTLTSTDLHARSIVSNMPYLLDQSRDSQISGCHSKWPSLKAWFFPSAQASQLKRTYLYQHQLELKSKKRQGCSMSKYEANKETADDMLVTFRFFF
jgi:hypothetical protein